MSVRLYRYELAEDIYTRTSNNNELSSILFLKVFENKCISRSLFPRGSVASDLFLRANKLCGFCLRGRDNNNYHHYYFKFAFNTAFSWLHSPRGLRPNRYPAFTITHHTQLDSTWRVIGPSQRPPPDNTQQSRKTDIHDPAGYETAISGSEGPQNHAFESTAACFGSDTSIIVILLLIKIKDENLQVLLVFPFFCPQKQEHFHIIPALKKFSTTTKHV